MELGSKIFIPELELYSVTSKIVEAIRDDYNTAKEEESFLFRIFQDARQDKYKFYEQAVEIFTRKGNDSRELAVRLFFDAKRADLPTIHINLPGESSGENGMGSDEGFRPPLFDDPALEFVRQFNRRFKASYQVIFTSSNSLEVVLLYHAFRAAMIANLGGMEVLGFTNLSLGGNDLILDPSIIPTTVFVRGFVLNFSYEVTAPALVNERFYTDIFAKGTPIILD